MGWNHKQGIIAPVNGPSAWVNTLVIHEKSNHRLRTCLDPKGLNKVIKREHHSVLTMDKFTSKLCGSTLSSVLDAKQGYWNVKLDEKSSYLTTFNTHKGRYRFLRMPFGLRMSQDIFSEENLWGLWEIKGAVGVANDINVFCTESTHDYNLHKAMERTRKASIKLNFDKCIVK